MAVAREYLTQTLGRASVWPASRLETIPARHYDLIINVSSFDEMSVPQVSHYQLKLSFNDSEPNAHVYNVVVTVKYK